MPFSLAIKETRIAMTCMIMAAFLITDGFIWAACCQVMARESNTNSIPLIATVSSSSSRRSIISNIAFETSFMSVVAGFLRAGRASTTKGSPRERPVSGSTSLRHPHTRGTEARRHTNTNTTLRHYGEANTVTRSWERSPPDH